MIKPVFFNSAIVRARPNLVLRQATGPARDFAVRWALLPETPIGPCLIDTGYNHALMQGKTRSWGLRLYYHLLRPRLLEAGQIAPALRRYGLTEADIAAVIITHFHADHICGLRRFDKARLFISRAAAEQLAQTSVIRLWLKGIFPELLPADLAARAAFIENCAGREVLGFKTYDLFGNGQCLALPLPGHARGHFGLLFPEEKLLYAVDCAWSSDALEPGQRLAWAAEHIVDSPGQTLDSINIIRQFKAKGYEIALCHEPNRGDYDA